MLTFALTFCLLLSDPSQPVVLEGQEHAFPHPVRTWRDNHPKPTDADGNVIQHPVARRIWQRFTGGIRTAVTSAFDAVIELLGFPGWIKDMAERAAAIASLFCVILPIGMACFIIVMIVKKVVG